MTPGKLLLVLALAVSSLPAQESRLSASLPSWKGLEVRFLTKVEPQGNSASRLPGAIIVDNGRIHHLIQDDATKRSFGYDLRLEPNSDLTSVQLYIEPMQFTPGHEVSANAGFTMMALPRYPVIPKVRVGDTVAVSLLVNPSTGQRVMDYLTVTRAVETPPHDFTLADVELLLDRPRVEIDGKLVEAGTDFPMAIRAAWLWLYIEGRGRFIVSLFPNEKLGFSKNGQTFGNTLTFRAGSSEYRVESRTPIAPGPGAYNLYVLHQPTWHGTRDAFTIGGVDRPESIIGGKR